MQWVLARPAIKETKAISSFFSSLFVLNKTGATTGTGATKIPVRSLEIDSMTIRRWTGQLEEDLKATAETAHGGYSELVRQAVAG